jgi:peptide/nickel transport system permease protein
MSEFKMMPKVSTFNIEPEIARPRVSELRRIYKVMFSRRIVLFGTFIILAFIVVSIFAPVIAPYDPYKTDLRATLQQPSKMHLLGTDELGRDLLSRIIYGSRISIMVGIVAVGIASVIGMGLGLIAGYFGRWINTIIMRCVDALLSIPPLVLAIAIATILGGGLVNIMIALGFSMMPMYCRLMCGQILSVKENDFITAAYVIGANDLRIMIRHLLPNAFPPLLVLITLNIGTAILAEAGLSFLGIGMTPPAAAWGGMVSWGYKYLLTNPLLSFAPGICVLLVVLSFNLVGDGLRDALDPRLRGTI